MDITGKVCSYDSLKRSTDIIGSALLLLFLSPVMAITALLVRFSSPGPVIYRQKRLTQGGRTFEMYKFRTMVSNAEGATGPVWAAISDPRVTPLGRILRTTHLDELPQLLNVLMGDMSLIGPRPERPEMAAELAAELPSFWRRLEVKAGITGLAQVSTGYVSSVRNYRRKLALDILYIEKRSLLLDLKIAFQTVMVIITGRGAR